MLTMKNLNKINRRLKKLGSAVTAIAEAGKDKQRHRLVSISCSRCGVGTEWRTETKVMRVSDLTRKCSKNRLTGKKTGPAKSCGCLEREAHQRYLCSRKRSPPLLAVRRRWTSFWTQVDDDILPPLLLCQKAMRDFRFYASVPSRAPVIAKAP